MFLVFQKYKGNKIEKNKIKINIDTCNDVIITRSKNGFCYLCDVFNKENNMAKNYNYEYFKIDSYNTIISVAQFVSEKCYVDFFKEILLVANKVFLSRFLLLFFNQNYKIIYL